MQTDGPKSPADGPEERESDNIWFVEIPPDKLVVRLQAVVKRAVPWLAERKSPGSLECTALVGPAGQIVIRPANRLPEAWKKVAASLKKRPAEFGDERRPWFEIARLQAASSLVTVSLEPNGRVSIYLSTILADAKIGPGRGEDSTVLAIGDVLEVWRRDVWENWLRKSGENADATEKAALHAIVRRSE